MRFINSLSTDAGFNLAAEEYLLKQGTEDVFMLWQSAPSIIIGKHQRMEAEVNLTVAGKNRSLYSAVFPVVAQYITIWVISILHLLRLPAWHVLRLIWRKRLQC